MTAVELLLLVLADILRSIELCTMMPMSLRVCSPLIVL